MNEQLLKTSGTDVLSSTKKNSEKKLIRRGGEYTPTPLYVRGLSGQLAITRGWPLMLYDTGSTVLNTISRKLQGEKSIYLKLDVKLRHFISQVMH